MLCMQAVLTALMSMPPGFGALPVSLRTALARTDTPGGM